MRTLLISIAATLAFAVVGIAHAQPPTGAPAGTTGQCKDGTWYSGETKKGACRGHKGVKEWYGATEAAPAPTAPAKSATAAPPKSPTATPAPAMMPPQTFPKSTPQTMPNAQTPTTGTQMGSRPTLPGGMSRPSGGGSGRVWVDRSSRTYVCDGERGYGTSSGGSYMSESDATAQGNRPADGASCAH